MFKQAYNKRHRVKGQRGRLSDVVANLVLQSLHRSEVSRQCHLVRIVLDARRPGR